MMLELYPEVRQGHVLAILLSGGWMAVRGAAMLAGMQWPRRMPAWGVALTIDATLLTAAVLLLTMLPAELFANGWLAVKLAFVGVYFVAGYWAFLGDLQRRTRALALGVAAIAYFIAYGIARAHDPLGWLAGW